jgi:sec-independent protein translocase protein TatA
MRLGPLGITEILIILAVLLLLFGATRLPQVGKSLGASMRAFKRAVTGEDDQEPGKNEGDNTPVGKGTER